MRVYTPAEVPSLADTKAVPRFSGGRIEILDALRGFAVFGILLANVRVFSGHYLLGDAQRAALPGGSLDGVLYPLLHAVLDGKFYSIFSLLFGIGFAIQLRRFEAAGGDGVARYRRRLWLLLAIGAAHAFLIWAGDILMLYAMAGFALLAFRSKDERGLMRSAVVFVLIPPVQYGLVLLAASMRGAAAGGGPPDGVLDAAIVTMSTGNYLEVMRQNLVTLAFRWMDLLFSGRFFKVLALFLFGAWVVRRGLLTDTVENRRVIARVAKWGLGLGIPLNIAMAVIGDGAYYGLQPAGMLYAVLYSVGVPLLGIGYAAAVATLWRTRPARRALAAFMPVGRMALTNYLMHSVVALFVFTGVGLGLYGRVSLASGVLIAALLFVAQVPLSAWWLRRFRHGPAEWLWRRLTLGEPIPFRR